MSTTISVNKRSVKQLLEDGASRPFVIPEYQRPYAWTSDQVQTLFEDLWEFASTIGGAERDGTYFLGSIVSFENDSREQEIIDGQQRITSLFLLLRAIYAKIFNSEDKNGNAENFIRQIQPTLWRTDRLSGKVNYSDTLLTSKVVNEEYNKILRDILETGNANEAAEDNYSRNYCSFQRLLNSYAAKHPLDIYGFIYALLNQAIMLPISADTQDTALTIFSTLNDRGLPLSDADIFKAKIYNKLNDKRKKTFIKEWKELEEKAGDADESIQHIFYYYMFYIRATKNDNDSTTPGIRKYYSVNKFERLFEPKLMQHFSTILNIWKVVNRHLPIDREGWSVNKNIIKTLDILNSYPNEFWKYPVVIYYLKHRDSADFEKCFSLFLNKLLRELLVKYILAPTINAVKSDILKLNVEIIKSTHPTFEFKSIDESPLEKNIKTPHRNAVRMLLGILAYEKQDELLPTKWEIEHIFPQKYQSTYFTNTSEDEIREKIEHLGNKLPFEKKLNIVAGNGYFGKKKKEYELSMIAITKDMSQISTSEWNLDNIIVRDVRVADSILEVFVRWNSEYQQPLKETMDKSIPKVTCSN